MSDCKNSYFIPANLDPYKRVKYSTGLVLGVDEFLQEELYHCEKHRWANRSLHGYGTVCGLHVSVEDTGGGPQVRVSAGIAINPQGQEIRVPQDQCSLLNDWLSRNPDDVIEHLGSPPLTSPPQTLPLYLVLCYQECETDMVPIPSGPCQSIDQTSRASRIAENFELKFSTNPPDQREDDKIRELVALLKGIEISESGDMQSDEIEDLVRTLIHPTSPPAAVSHMHPEKVPDLLRAAFRVWVTEVRPQILSSGQNCAASPPEEKCVLLAELQFAVEETGAGFRVSGTAEDVAIAEDDRPYLLHTRLLQEYILGGSSLVGSGGSPYGVIAAGRFNYQGEKIGPVYKKLRVDPMQLQPGVFTVNFNGYKSPDASDAEHNYIVKCTGVGGDLTFHVIKFLPIKGIRVRIRGEESDEKLGFMIEITVFGKFERER